LLGNPTDPFLLPNSQAEEYRAALSMQPAKSGNKTQ